MMTKEHKDRRRPISRREFLAGAASVAAAGLFAGCQSAQEQAAAPTGTPIPIDSPASATSTSTHTPSPTHTPTPVPTVQTRHPDVIHLYPDVPSKVVQAHHAGVWDGETLVPETLRQMLDASLTELTGMDDAHDAWGALFTPDERIAIKVNAIRGGITHPALVMAVTNCLQDAGVPAEQITIFDRNTAELRIAGYAANVDGPGVRCYGNGEDWGTRGNYTEGWTLLDTAIKFSDILLGCDALINIPILKAAGGPGISFAMKNHYGTFNIPQAFHGEKFARAIPELNALPPIKDRTRLTIGDVLTPGSPPAGLDGYQIVGLGDAILASFDPVAHDAVGLQIVREYLVSTDRDPTATIEQASPWLAHGATIGLGTDDPENIDLVKLDVA